MNCIPIPRTPAEVLLWLALCAVGAPDARLFYALQIVLALALYGGAMLLARRLLK